MLKIPAISAWKWPEKAAHNLISAISLIVFGFLDLLDIILCIFYRFFDGFMEENPTPCYCGNKWNDREEVEISESLYQRKNIFRDVVIMGLLKLRRKREGCCFSNSNSHSMKKGGSNSMVKSRWSDCDCDSCVSWQQSGDHKLHVVVMEPSSQGEETNDDCRRKPVENVVFLHGFLSSSYFWTETVFPNLSETGKQNYRLFAVDLLGFGKSPKPWDCFYTLKDHLEMVEKSVINQFQLNTFHIVAHSMGGIIALALAAKYMKSVKSITLIASPYFPPSKERASLIALNRLAERRLWPPLLFASSFMSWYEHLGRSVCFLVCKNHRRWEWILNLLTQRRDLQLKLFDLTRHTHHSAWHTMHNVICGGAKLMDENLEAVRELRVVLTVIQGDKDNVVPLECSHNMKLKVPHADVRTILNADHTTVILGREKQFTRDLEYIWISVEENYKLKDM